MPKLKDTLSKYWQLVHLVQSFVLLYRGLAIGSMKLELLKNATPIK